MTIKLHIQGVPKKMFISNKGARLNNEHFFLGHLVHIKIGFTISVLFYLVIDNVSFGDFLSPKGITEKLFIFVVW